MVLGRNLDASGHPVASYDSQLRVNTSNEQVGAGGGRLGAGGLAHERGRKRKRQRGELRCLAL